MICRYITCRSICLRCVSCDVVISGKGQHLEPLALKLVLLAVGLWLNIPDYDAPTQMVKPHERNTRYVDAVMTIPKVCLSGKRLLLFCNTKPAALLHECPARESGGPVPTPLTR